MRGEETYLNPRGRGGEFTLRAAQGPSELPMSRQPEITPEQHAFYDAVYEIVADERFVTSSIAGAIMKIGLWTDVRGHILTEMQGAMLEQAYEDALHRKVDQMNRDQASTQ